ncbi:hypothetical protein TrRE_jg2151 [Triparma retinervis]|uniref:Uncharacterized protein n=1 Tax=Triparma retinervis TaxID=2557542 RepID=A0A9W7CPS7_9STRA|nr:hypothetical protein TrRE_jg2151 [Triparma retinervis]
MKTSVKNALSGLCSIILFTFSVLILFHYEEVARETVPAHFVSTRALTPRGNEELHSNDYMVRCRSMLSACDPEYFMLSSRGELIHGWGDSPENSKGIIWKSKSKGDGEYILRYEGSTSGSSYVTIIRKGIIPRINDVLDGLGGEEVEEGDESGELQNFWRDFLDVLTRKEHGGEERGESTLAQGGVGGEVGPRKVFGKVTKKTKNLIIFMADKFGIMKDKTKNRRVFRRNVKKLPHLTPWPFL